MNFKSVAMKLFVPVFISFAALVSSCSKKDSSPAPPPPPVSSFAFNALRVNGAYNGFNYTGISNTSNFRIAFSGPVARTSVATAVQLKDKTGATAAYNVVYENGDSSIFITPAAPLEHLTRYTLSATTALKSTNGKSLLSGIDVNFLTSLDSSRKFPIISDDQLLTRVQQQTFKYFWDFAHPVSGLARERSNGDDNIITIGGSGFGLMAIITGVERGFITRVEALTRLKTITSFLKNTTQKFHGAFSHWINGATGEVIPFGNDDNGADLVETSYLIQGLLTVREYFNGAAAAEVALRNDINVLWNGVEWDWFRQGGQNQLYWHWSPTLGWQKNFIIRGWNECLITYVLAAASPTHGIPKIVYDNGWANNGAMKNGATYYSYQLPLGPNLGGPLFFEHYSFLGLNPQGLTDTYANYETQTKNHTLINYEYSKANPKGFYGYSDSVWGLTASDIEGGYKASSPTEDAGFIAPTAALSSFPYTPKESMQALKFYYYVLGDKLWKTYGFVDAFSLQSPWFANSFLAIDQGPIICMIENYRTKLLWNLFTGAPEVKTGLISLGFTAPYL